MRKATALLTVVGVTALGGYAIAGDAEEGAPHIEASKCPEQARTLAEAGVSADFFAGNECPSMEDVNRVVESMNRKADQARADQKELAAARESGTLGPDTDQWMRGVGDDARLLTPEEVEAVESRIEQRKSE